MINLASCGKWLVFLGLALVVAGGAIWLLGRTGLPLGRLPGDIHIERENISCHVPLVTMVVVSLPLTILLNVIIRLMNR